MFKRLINIAIGVILAIAAVASINQLPIRNINGVSYYVYQVQPGEGELAIAKKLDINVADINKHNPTANAGLKAYQELLFPVNNYDDSSKTLNIDSNPSLPATYTAKKGDTLYGICKKFGIDESYFLNLNPEAANGIKAEQIYNLKKESESSLSTNNTKQSSKKHTIERGESLYAIAHANNCSIEEILAINPDLDVANYKEGQVIEIPSKKSDATSIVENAFKQKTNKYTVRPNDTFYSIARNFGVSIAQLQMANPGLNLLQEGMEINIPDSCTEEVNTPEIINDNNQTIIWGQSQELPIIHTKEPIRIAVALPFNASSKNSKQNKNYVDFYRGFMLAVDSFKINQQPVAVYAFDINSADKIKSLKNDSLLAKSNIIISAGATDNCGELNDYAKNHNVNLFNIFSVRDSSYLTNENVMQGNIPTRELINLAVKYVKNNFIGYTPVILEVNGANDKLSIANKIAEELEKEGSTVKRIKISETPTVSNFKSLNLIDKCLILPSTSKIAFTKELLKALTAESNAKLIEKGATLFGYPEWITLKDKTVLSQLKKLNTYIYSRFTEPNEFDKNNVVSSHKHWFGKGISAGSPSMTLTGYDVGTYLIRILEENRGDFDKIVFNPNFEGIQYPFNFKRVDNGGYINEAAYIVHFSLDGEIENILIRK